MISTSPHQYRSEAELFGVSAEIATRAIDQARGPEQNGLPAILTLRHLSHLTGARYEYLRSIIARHHDAYSPFTIRKKSGKRRFIAAPEPELMAVQRWIATTILAKLQPHHASKAYAPGSSPYKCAKFHLGARWLVKIDIHDFFESISERRAYWVFRTCDYQPLVAFELARLCSRIGESKLARSKEWQSGRRGKSPTIGSYSNGLMGHLPQGAPTSPMLSNLVSYPLDELLDQLAAQRGLIYTRYSDDIVFSTADDISRREALVLVKTASRVFDSFGHRLHESKITIAPPGARKIVLGLLVDGGKVRLTREFRSRVESHVRGIEKFGIVAHAAARRFSSLWGMVRHIEGLLAHASSIDSEFTDPLRFRLASALANSGWPAAANQDA